MFSTVTVLHRGFNFTYDTTGGWVTKRKSRVNPPRLTGLRFLKKGNRISVDCAQGLPFYKDSLTNVCLKVQMFSGRIKDIEVKAFLLS